MRKKHFKREDYGGKLVPVVFADQIRPGSIEHALCHLLDRIDLSGFEARYCNEMTGAPAYHPRVRLAYSREVTSSRGIESLCCRDVQFMAVSKDMRAQFRTIAGFIARASEETVGLFSEVPLMCSKDHRGVSTAQGRRNDRGGYRATVLCPGSLSSPPSASPAL